MHITITAEGSRGDVQPFIALAKGLQSADHTPLLIAPQNCKEMIAAHDIDYHPLPVDIQAIMQGEIGQKFTQNGRNPLTVLRAMKNAIAPELNRYFQTLQALVETTDLFITYSASSFLALILNEVYGIPFIVTSFFPLMQTAQHPSALWFSQVNLGSWYNKGTASIVFRMMWC